MRKTNHILYYSFCHSTCINVVDTIVPYRWNRKSQIPKLNIYTVY